MTYFAIKFQPTNWTVVICVLFVWVTDGYFTHMEWSGCYQYVSVIVNASSWFVATVALSSLLSQLFTQSSNPGNLSDELSTVLAGLVPDSLASNSSTLHNTAAELLSSMCHHYYDCFCDVVMSRLQLRLGRFDCRPISSVQAVSLLASVNKQHNLLTGKPGR